MFDVGHMNFFDITECGLYKVSSTDTHGLEVSETFNLIKEWVDGRPLAKTIPWSPNSANDNKAKCYCKEIYKCEHSGDFVLKLWKSDSGSAGTLWGAHEDDEDGSKEEFEYTSTTNKDNVIWGRPCYYWVIPYLDTVVSIKFDYSLCDAEMFENFVTKCITNRIDHPKRVKRHTKNGYVRLSAEDDENSNLSFRFSTQLKSMNTSNAEMQKLAARVTHIINRETVVVSSKDDRKTWTKRFNKCVPFLKPPLNHDKRKIEVRAEARPSAAEIKKIIESNAKENRKPSDWENVGFETEDGKTTWADKYRLSDTIRIDKTNGKLITAEKLCKSLQSNRNRYTHDIERELALINKDSR